MILKHYMSILTELYVQLDKEERILPYLFGILQPKKLLLNFNKEEILEQLDL